MKRIGKLLIMFFLAGMTTLSSFVAGMIFYANFYAPAQAASAMTALSLVPAGASQQSITITAATPPEFNTFWEAWSFLEDQFYGDIPPNDERVHGAIRGMVNSFGDQHTAFVDPTRAAIMSENISGSFEGIGATLRLNEMGQLMIADSLPGRPAFEAGLRPGDVILEVDSESVKDLNLYEAVALIRGPAGSTVVLTIGREDEAESLEVAVVRAKIEIQIVQTEMLESHIGYIRLTQFSNGASEKMAEAIESLFDQGATSLIFDLRSNPGGLLSEAVDVSSLFLAEGTVVIERLKGGEEKLFEAENRPHVATETPLVVLVNGGSASASEIVAGAVQDSGRATIIGEQTFGKGSVQLPHTLTDGSELRVTIAEWLTPGRRQIHGQGITPDLVVEMTAADLEQQLDPQLARAVDFLKESLNNDPTNQRLTESTENK